jgi:hypothetical protein
MTRRPADRAPPLITRAVWVALAVLSLASCRPKPDSTSAVKDYYGYGAPSFLTGTDPMGQLRVKLDGVPEAIVEVRTIAIASNGTRRSLGVVPKQKYVALMPTGSSATAPNFTIEASTSSGRVCHMQGKGAPIPGYLRGVICGGATGAGVGAGVNYGTNGYGLTDAAPEAAAAQAAPPSASEFDEFNGACRSVWGDLQSLGREELCMCDVGPGGTPKAVTYSAWKRDHSTVHRVCAGG